MLGRICSRQDSTADELNTLRRRAGSRHSHQPAAHFKPAEHGVVLMRGVVAVLHEHPRELPELHGDGNTSTGMEAIGVLAAPLPRRHIAEAAVAGEDLALFEMGMDRVIPASATVF